jgi:hypothetical protein
MVVRLLDAEGRFSWAAGWDGVAKTWVRARRDLAGCGPVLDWPVLDSPEHTLPPARGAADAPPCREERPVYRAGLRNPSTVLR